MRDQRTPISVYLDNHVWDFLCERKLDLCAELPPDEFRVYITREAEFEIPPMPPGLRAFTEATIARCGVRTDAMFGFYDNRYPPDKQRVLGWNQGRWASPQEKAFIDQQAHRLGELNSSTGLHEHEADRALAARALQAVILSSDRRGPIKEAAKQGGQVVSLMNFDTSGLSLGAFIKAAIQTQSAPA